MQYKIVRLIYQNIKVNTDFHFYKNFSSSWTYCTVDSFVNLWFENVTNSCIFLFVFSCLGLEHICFINPLSSSFLWFALYHFHLNHQVTGLLVSLSCLHSFNLNLLSQRLDLMLFVIVWPTYHIIFFSDFTFKLWY